MLPRQGGRGKRDCERIRIERVHGADVEEQQASGAARAACGRTENLSVRKEEMFGRWLQRAAPAACWVV